MTLDQECVELEEDVREDFDFVGMLRPYELAELNQTRDVPTVLSEERLLIAELSLYEFPVRFMEAYGRSWFMIMDAIDGDAADLGEIADQLVEKAEERGDFVLPDGSLFVPKTLSVHPAFRGNAIGVRLLAPFVSAGPRGERRSALPRWAAS